ncbi:MAG: Holliday junction branch migration protein RuvA [Legionellales bacterium]|nr:Holliday junction branch migration protein RuvA [Legionellales bacterium]
MIGRIRGQIIAKQVPLVVIDINGLGYEVETSMMTFFKLPDVNQSVELFTHHVVREDAQILFGFYEETERRLFRTLIKVNGVGPKLALSILSSIQPQVFADCVQNKDITTLVRLPGVGKKTAERLIIEMQDKLMDFHKLNSASELITVDSAVSSNQNQIVKEAMSALINLGYKPQEASKMLSPFNDENLSCEELIKQALKGRVKHD